MEQFQKDLCRYANGIMEIRLRVSRNGIEDMGCKLRVCYFKPESELNPVAAEHYEANILGCARQFRYSPSHKTRWIWCCLSMV